MTAEGSITLNDGSSSQSGHFALKSKRLKGFTEPTRVDSLSLIVTGPFGITGVKFLGAPEEYQFYNAIQGDKYRGRPDPKTLQGLTGMQGLTLESLSDVLYGMSPSSSQLGIGDTAIIRSLSEDRHVLYIQRGALHITEAISLKGKLPSGVRDNATLIITQYDRWNSIISFESSTVPKSDISVSYSGVYGKRDFSLPNFITARSGNTSLEIEYTDADQNPKDLTVRIKMPK